MNILSADNSTFVSGIADWGPFNSRTILGTATTPDPPGGGDVLTCTRDGTGLIGADLSQFYSVTPGVTYEVSLETECDPANAGTPVDAILYLRVNPSGAIYAVN